ncbi:MAG: hypothetical protein V3T48_07230 [Vicinamibacterales bacterium]
MTRPDRQGPFAVLVRNFFHGLFESDLVPEDVDVRQSLTWVFALCLGPPLHLALGLPLVNRPHPQTLRLAQQNGTVEQLLAQFERLMWGFELVFVLHAMMLVGFITVMVWDRAYPDRRDLMVLGTVPVRERTVFGAKLAALLLLVVGTVVAVSLPTSVVMALGARHSDAGLIQLRYLVAHLVVMPSAGLFVFSCLFTVQALLATFASARVVRALSVGLQVLSVIGVLQMLLFSTILSRWFAENALQLSGDSVASWVPAFWFLGLYETMLGTEHAIFRALAPRAGWATVGSLAVATVTYFAGYARFRRRGLESPAPLAREPGAWARAVDWVTYRVLVRGATAQALVGFVAKTLRRSQRYPLLLAVYVGSALGLIGLIVRLSWPVTADGASGAAVVRGMFDVSGAAAVGLGVPTIALLSIPHILSLFSLVGLRVLFTVPSELPAHWIFRLSEQDGKTGYLRGTRAVLRLALVPIVALTLPGYWLLWGAPLAVGHTVLWVLQATVLAELLLIGFYKVPFACAYVPGGRTNFMLLGTVSLMAFIAYVVSSSRAELWLLAGPAQWGVACAALTVCLAVTTGMNDRARLTARPLTFKPSTEAAPAALNLSVVDGHVSDRPVREDDVSWNDAVLGSSVRWSRAVQRIGGGCGRRPRPGDAARQRRASRCRVWAEAIRQGTRIRGDRYRLACPGASD